MLAALWRSSGRSLRCGQAEQGSTVVENTTTQGMMSALALCAGSLAGGAHTAALVPVCAGSEVDSQNPHPNCIFRPWAYPKQAATFHGTATVTKAPTRIGQTWNQQFTVTLHYTVPYKKFCPSNGASTADFPCQIVGADPSGKPGVRFQILGAYIHGRPTFAEDQPARDHGDLPHGFGDLRRDLRDEHVFGLGAFRARPEHAARLLRALSWQGAGGIAGGGGFETAISVTFPKLKGSSPVQLHP